MIEGFKTSPIQQTSWLQSRAVSGFPAYAELTLLITGELDPVALQKAIATVVARWEIFQTRFPFASGMIIPLQVIGDPTFEWTIKTLPPETSPSELFGTGTKDFDYENGPLLKATLFILETRRHVLQLRMPTVMADNGTLNMLPGAIGAALDGEEPEEAPRYVAVAQWLNELLSSEDSEEGLAFWNGIDCANRVHFDLTNPTDKDTSFVPGRLNCRPLELLEPLEAIAEQYQSDLETVCFTAWNVLLHRLLGEQKIVVSMAFNGRSDEDLEDVAGPLDRFLPVEVPINGDMTFSDLLQKVGGFSQEAFEWLECFANKEAHYTSLAFAYETELQPVEAAGLVLRLLDKSAGGACYDLKLNVVASEKSLQADLHFNQSLFTPAHIKLIHERFGTLLAAIIDKPEAAIATFQIMGEREKRMVLNEFNQLNAVYPQDQCFHQLFESQAARTPDKIAVEYAQESLTYKELSDRSDVMASVLRKMGAGPECFVAISGVRSTEFVIGMLAIFKAGAIYQPLDPEYPKPLLEYELALTRPVAFMAFKHEVPSLPKHGAQMVFLDEVNRASEDSPTKWASVTTNHAAYIIFTSGSSGKPKGVLVSHHSLSNQCLAVADHHQLTERDRFLQFSSLNFDASLEQILPPLIRGATTVLRDPDGWEGENVDRKIDALNVTIINIPTAYWHLLTREWTLQRCVLPNGKLRLVIVGGESMLDEYVTLWQKSPLKSIPLVNAYGPTEATISATMFDVPEDYAEQTNLAGLPIGRPLANRRLYILDATGRPVGVGEIGTLLIGGAGLARGYHKASGLTAASFVPNPFSSKSGERLYDTGDRARFLTNGQLQFRGRRDHQVKIRGYRIELGEIEAVLTGHWAVQEVLVLNREVAGAPESTRLTAYYIAPEGAELHLNELRDFTAERLPQYMVPSSFVKIDAWPMQAGGKVDRNALPDPESEGNHKLLAPKKPTEKILAQMWCSLLGLSQVGLDSNFFDLGGHSLLTTQLVSRIRRVFDVEIDLIQFFTVTSLMGQAELIDTKKREGKGLVAPPLLVVDRNQTLQISFAQQRLWMFQQLNPDSVAYNQPMKLKVSGPLQIVALEKVFGDLVKRHEILRTTFSLKDQTPAQVIQPFLGWTLTFVDVHDLSQTEQEAEVNRLADRDARTIFDLEKGPLIRVRLLKLGENIYTLLFNTHHIISDGWSHDIMIREMVNLYRATVEGKPNPLPDLAIQYADYSQWQRRWLQGKVLENQLGYWTKQLDGMPQTQNMPGVSGETKPHTNRAGQRNFTFSKALSDALNDLCRDELVTLFMLLLAGFKTLVHVMTGDEDIVVGTDVANRNQVETENLLGFFVNQLVLRTDASNDPSFKGLLERVRQVALGAYAHQDLSFDKLVETLNPNREGDQNPLFRMKLVVQNAPTSNWELPNLVIQAQPVDSGSAKFDLLFNIVEDASTVSGFVQYNSDIYNDSDIARLLAIYEAILEKATEDKDTAISSFKPLLAVVDRQQEEDSLKRLKATSLNKFKSLKKGLAEGGAS